MTNGLANDTTGTAGREGLETGASRALRGRFFFHFMFFYYANNYLKVHYASIPNPPRHVQQPTNRRHQRGPQRQRMGSRSVSSPRCTFFFIFSLLLTCIYSLYAKPLPLKHHVTPRKGPLARHEWAARDWAGGLEMRRYVNSGTSPPRSTNLPRLETRASRVHVLYI
jgi:hypothetical protein